MLGVFVVCSCDQNRFSINDLCLYVFQIFVCYFSGGIRCEYGQRGIIVQVNYDVEFLCDGNSVYLLQAVVMSKICTLKCMW